MMQPRHYHVVTLILKKYSGCICGWAFDGTKDETQFIFAIQGACHRSTKQGNCHHLESHTKNWFGLSDECKKYGEEVSVGDLVASRVWTGSTIGRYGLLQLCSDTMIEIDMK